MHNFRKSIKDARVFQQNGRIKIDGIYFSKYPFYPRNVFCTLVEIPLDNLAHHSFSFEIERENSICMFSFEIVRDSNPIRNFKGEYLSDDSSNDFILVIIQNQARPSRYSFSFEGAVKQAEKILNLMNLTLN